ncbi:MAG: four-carbon acid sugar kinase family protein [Chitinophagaceae bacterium]|nr:MAG: four-carbon acid sugar kinase family protein [Chitinophagaceae bacterium]
MNKHPNILLAFYGDDLTGSTDALEFICRAGAKAVLFMEVPTEEQLKTYPDIQVFGIAGHTRALPTEEMEKQLQPAFTAIKQTGARHVHYKVCSTFDSTPFIGSIGKAIDIGAAVFQNRFVPVLGGMPALGRYCVFGNLFARMGIGSNGNVYRLDRHPSMSIHPVTPATESDLRLHLGAQTKEKIGLIDIVEMEKHTQLWTKAIKEQEEVVLLDASQVEHLQKIGEWLDQQSDDNTQVFSVGSSGIEFALGAWWNKTKLLHPVQAWPQVKEALPLLVLSGSYSPVSRYQIAYAVLQGFIEVPLVMNGSAVDCNLDKVLTAVRSNQSVIIHTGEIKGVDQSSSAAILGKALGSIGKTLCERIQIQRLVVAGGDTSSYAARALGIEALEMIAPFLPGAPLCKARAPGSPVDGMEVNFKGGQVGAEDYFVVMRDGNVSKTALAQ